MEIRGGQGGLLDRIQFVTSRGRESKAYGGSGGDAFSFKATAPPPPQLAVVNSYTQTRAFEAARSLLGRRAMAR